MGREVGAVWYRAAEINLPTIAIDWLDTGE